MSHRTRQDGLFVLTSCTDTRGLRCQDLNTGLLKNLQETKRRKLPSSSEQLFSPASLSLCGVLKDTGRLVYAACASLRINLHCHMVEFMSPLGCVNGPSSTLNIATAVTFMCTLTDHFTLLACICSQLCSVDASVLTCRPYP